MNEPAYQVGELVYRALDIDCMGDETLMPGVDRSEPTLYTVIKAVGECVSGKLWLYNYFVRSAQTFDVVDFSEAELCGRKQAELTFKLVGDRRAEQEKKLAMLKMDAELAVERQRAVAQQQFAKTLSDSIDKEMFQKLSTIPLSPIQEMLRPIKSDDKIDALALSFEVMKSGVIDFDGTT